jgi:hypothetical protein
LVLCQHVPFKASIISVPPEVCGQQSGSFCIRTRYKSWGCTGRQPMVSTPTENCKV